MSGTTEKQQGRTILFILCFLLAMLVWIVFGQMHQYDFVNYDDDAYVYENPVVLNGFTLEGIKKVFTSKMRGIYYPLTMASFMLDRDLQGMKPAGFHRTNVLLHAATVIALFLILLQMTGALWRSAFVAALFAIHPLRVESVAWVTERKDVLSGLFFMLTIGAYLGYVRRPFSIFRYAPVCLLLALGLLAKPMLATTPFVLLLLDYWPLKRWQDKKCFPRILLEKIPLFLLSALSLAMAMGSHALTKTSDIPPVSFPWRVGNALVSYVVYIRQMIWPTGLTPHYPYPGTGLPLWQIGIAFLLLAAFSLMVLFQGKNRPWLRVGWFWYLGMLFPTIGIVRILGEAARADRFTYLPQIGLYILLAWSAAEWVARLRLPRAVPAIAGGAVLAALAATAYHQTTHWKNSISLWNHTLAHTTGNCLAHNNLALALEDKGEFAEAIRHYEQAIRISPNDPYANNNLGRLLASQGKTAEAIPHFRRAIQRNPNLAAPYYGLGAALARQGNPAEATPCFKQALRLNPDLAAPYFGLGTVLATQGKPDQAIPCFEQAIRLDPSVAAPHLALGRTLATQRKFDEAIPHLQKALQLQPDDPTIRDMLHRVLAAQKKQNRSPADTACKTGLKMQMEGAFSKAIQQYRQALRIDPDDYEAKNNLAWLLATCPEKTLRNGERAVELAEQVVQQIGKKNATVLDTLAAAYAEAGRYPEAIRTAQRAIQIMARQKGNSTGVRERLQLYQSGYPFHEPRKVRQ